MIVRYNTGHVYGGAWAGNGGQTSMSKLTRTGVSIEEDLLKKFDRTIAVRGYKNRSEALRDLIRDSLVAEEIASEQACRGDAFLHL